MLCKNCAEIFAFEDSDSIVWEKQDAIRQAEAQNLDNSQIQSLQREHDRYLNALQLRDTKSLLVPSPWGATKQLNAPSFETSSLSRGPRAKIRHWHEVKHSAGLTGCGLCKRLVTMIQSNTATTISGNATITSVWFLNRGSLIPDWLRFDFYDGESGSSMMLRFHSAITNIKQGEQVINHDTLLSTSTKDEACVNFFSRSLQRCLSTHEYCSIHQNDWVPTRMLEVSGIAGANGDCIRLIERDDLQTATTLSRYTTLSHVWGTTDPLKLTKADHKKFKSTIALDRLPQCFSDAVYITRRLGVSYLWIDSLCIIQDSIEDWAQEAATMSKVYRNGVCNIAACNGTTAFDSIFTERNPQMSEPLIVDREYSDQKIRFTIVPDWVNLTWNSAPLYKRAWVLQERFLSARMMHFSEFPFWECSAELTTESYPSHPETRGLDFPSFPKSQRSWVVSKEDADESVLRWWKLVHLYTGCKLTCNSDKLIALSGIASTLSVKVNEPYFAGIWGGKYLIPGLAWRVDGGSRRHELGSAEYQAPSWSWASHDGSVTLYEYRRILMPLIHVLSIHTTLKTENIFGQLLDGKLFLKGFLFEVYQAKYRRQNLRWKGEFNLDYESMAFFESAIYFLPLAELIDQSDEGRAFFGLYIQETVNSQSASILTYARIGDCHRMEGGGDGYMLDALSWEKLLKIESPKDYGQELAMS